LIEITPDPVSIQAIECLPIYAICRPGASRNPVIPMALQGIKTVSLLKTNSFVKKRRPGGFPAPGFRRDDVWIPAFAGHL
jgi:hypothetical protein